MWFVCNTIWTFWVWVFSIRGSGLHELKIVFPALNFHDSIQFLCSCLLCHLSGWKYQVTIDSTLLGNWFPHSEPYIKKQYRKVVKVMVMKITHTWIWDWLWYLVTVGTRNIYYAFPKLFFCQIKWVKYYINLKYYICIKYKYAYHRC